MKSIYAFFSQTEVQEATEVAKNILSISYIKWLSQYYFFSEPKILQHVEGCPTHALSQSCVDERLVNLFLNCISLCEDSAFSSLMSYVLFSLIYSRSVFKV